MTAAKTILLVSLTIAICVLASQEIDYHVIASSDTATVTGTIFTDYNGNGIQNAGEGGIEGYPMYAIDTSSPDVFREILTDSNGKYTFDNISAFPNTTLIQTTYFPFDHTVVDPNSSWFTYITPQAGETVTFDVGFHPVTPQEQVTLNVIIYHDVDGDGVQDAGESPMYDETVDVYTYTTNELETESTGADGVILKHDLIPADFVVQIDTPSGFTPTSPVITYPNGAQVFGAMIVDDPAPGSTRYMKIGLDDTEDECPPRGLNGENRCYAVKNYTLDSNPSSISIDVTADDIQVERSFAHNPIWLIFSEESKFIEAGFIDFSNDEKVICATGGRGDTAKTISYSDGDTFSINASRNGMLWEMSVTHNESNTTVSCNITLGDDTIPKLLIGSEAVRPYNPLYQHEWNDLEINSNVATSLDFTFTYPDTTDNYYVDECGSGDEQYRHFKTGKGKFLPC